MTRNEIERTLRRCMNGRGWKDELTEGMLDFWVQTLRTVSNSAGVPAIEQVMASVRSWGVASPGAVLKVARQRTEGERGSRPAVVSCDICGARASCPSMRTSLIHRTVTSGTSATS